MFIVDSKESENKSCENIKSTPLVVLKINASAVVLSYIFIGQSEGDTCSWKGQLERTRSWKVLSWKVWSWKVWPKLERAKRSWKEPSEVGKNRAKLESTTELMMNFLTSVTTFKIHSNFSTSARTFQLRRIFLTSIGSFQFRSVLSNFAWLFPTSDFPT